MQLSGSHFHVHQSKLKSCIRLQSLTTKPDVHQCPTKLSTHSVHTFYTSFPHLSTHRSSTHLFQFSFSVHCEALATKCQSCGTFRNLRSTCAETLAGGGPHGFRVMALEDLGTACASGNIRSHPKSCGFFHRPVESQCLDPSCNTASI